jgi:tetratricopeptide (TPR) repeat protein
VKSIVHPELVSLPNSPHHFIYQPGSWCVNEVKQRVDNQLAPHIAEKIQINHYWSRSENEYFQKLERGRGDGGDPYPFERLKYTTDFSVEMDLEIFNILAHYEVLTQDEVHQIITDRDFAQAVDLPGRLHRRILDLPALPKPFRLDETRVPPENEPISYLRKMDGMIKLAAEGKDIELVEEYLQNIIALYREGVMFRLYLADIYILLNDPPKSWNALAGAWKIAPRSFEVLFLMGKYYQALNQYEQAEKIYRLLLQQDPEGFSAMFNLAAVLIHTHSFDEAFALVTQAIHLFSYTLKMPELLDVVKTLGVYYYKNGELERAREMYQKALEYNPDDLELLSNLGRVCLDMERYDAAQAYLTRAVEIHPDDEELKIGLHLVRARLAANHQPAA